MSAIVYGLGGFDPEHPTGNVIERHDETGHHYYDGKSWTTEPLTAEEQAEFARDAAAAAETAERERVALKTQAVIADAYAKLPDGALKDFAAALCVAVSDIDTPESAKEWVEDHPAEAAAEAVKTETEVR